MREIKFRAWDEDKEQYCYEIQNIDEYFVEQYTGLKDKNGVEIYEGDIVNKLGNLYIVTWSEQSVRFYLYQKKGLDKELHSGLKDWFEVVGNIHENKDLLGEI